MADIQQPDHSSQAGPAAQIVGDQLAVSGPGAFAGSRKTVSGEVHQIQLGQAIEIEQGRLTRRSAYPGESRPPDQGVQQARFPDVGPSNEGDLRERRVDSDRWIGERTDELYRLGV